MSKTKKAGMWMVLAVLLSYATAACCVEFYGSTKSNAFPYGGISNVFITLGIEGDRGFTYTDTTNTDSAGSYFISTSTECGVTGVYIPDSEFPVTYRMTFSEPNHIGQEMTGNLASCEPSVAVDDRFMATGSDQDGDGVIENCQVWAGYDLDPHHDFKVDDNHCYLPSFDCSNSNFSDCVKCIYGPDPGYVCGDGICMVGEECIADTSHCSDTKCEEPICSGTTIFGFPFPVEICKGCTQIDVPAGGTDEACDETKGCSTPPCHCNGAGSCVSGPPTLECVTEVCDDTIDNDCDTLTDCDDPDCSADPACAVCVPEPEVCDDTLDNDCDGLADCDDPDCSADPACAVCVPEPELCDGLDNECDGYIDNAPGITADNTLTQPTTCGVGECSGNTGVETCTAEGWGGDTCDPLAGAAAEECTGGLDEDCDGLTDTEDPDCPLPQTCSSDLGGTQCGFAEICKGGNMVAADDYPFCCIGGTCARGILDISDNDFVICHDESCICTDFDGDGICDNEDNCNPLVYCPTNYPDCYNPEQNDTNLNGVGDVCDCVVPHDDLVITKDTVLCPGTYNIVDANEDGIIIFGKDNIFLDCNGAVIQSEGGCNSPGDVNRNGMLDGEDLFFVLDAVDRATPYIDLCMDANEDGSIDWDDVVYLDQNMVCPETGDLDSSGMLDSMDVYLANIMKDNSLSNACADYEGDGDVDNDDARAIAFQIDAENIRYCGDIPCADEDSCYCSLNDQRCERNGQEVLLLDFDYDGIYTQKDMVLLRSIMTGYITQDEEDRCLSGDESALIDPEDSTKLHSILEGSEPGAPRPACDVPGDASGNGYLDGLDLFLVGKAVEDVSGNIFSDFCCDANEDGKVNETDLLYLSNKLKGLKGTGIVAANNSIMMANCTFIGYEYGINLSSTGSTVTRNVLDNLNDLYMDTGASLDNVYHNHFYQSGITGPQAAGNLYCVGGEGNFYDKSIGYENIGG